MKLTRSYRRLFAFIGGSKRFLPALLALTLMAPLGAQSPARGLRDQEIQDDIRSRLAKSIIGKENFKVTVREGVAYWEGSTTVPQHKGAATRMAKAAKARSVVNKIVVGPPGAKAGAPTPRSKSAPKAKSQLAPPAEPPAQLRRVEVQWGPRPL
jgi:hypothetical protein